MRALHQICSLTGEELTFSYVSGDEPKADRNSVLKHKCAPVCYLRHSHQIRADAY